MPWTLEVESGTVAVRRARARLIFFQDLAMVQLHLVGIPKLLKATWLIPTPTPSHRNHAFLRDLSTVAHRPISAVVSMADSAQVVQQVLLLSTNTMVLNEF